MSYSFAYNSFGNIVSTRVGNTPVISHTYESNNGKLEASTYGNGDELYYTYDSLGRIIALSNDSEVLASYTYNKKSQITRIVDYGAGLATDFEYSPSGGCIGKSKYSSDLSSSYYEYETTDENGNSVKTTVVDGVTKTVTDSTDETGNYVLNNDGICLTSQSDDFGRKLTDSTLISEDKKLTTEYTYVDGANANETTELIESITHRCGNTVLAKYSYTYDENGNILTVSENDTERYVYTYDSLNQLINVVDKQSAVRYFYTYDNAGNIKTTSSQMWNSSTNTAMGSPTTNSYTYGNSNWTDLLTKYKSYTITYDAIGNPISYRDGMTFSWKNGRQLATLTKDNKTTSYTYDISGIRTQKNVDGTITKYYYNDSNNLISMTVGDKTLMFYYDQNGSVSSVLYNGVMYYYIKNLQGDIMRIVDENGNSIVIYAYDQWGKPTQMRQPSSTTVDLVNYNPFLYRGYVYDADSGLYYLQSRYYDPTTGRFLNADIYCDTQTGSTLSTNMFAYCENNAVNFVDPSGTDAIWLQDIDGVYGFGHTSLMLQTITKTWVYFYWGEDEIKVLVMPNFKFTSLKNTNNYLLRNMVYDGRYEAYVYFSGDFTKNLQYAFSLKYTRNTWWGCYNFMWRNCMQVSAEILAYNKSFAFNYVMFTVRKMVIPNNAYYSLLLFYRNSFFGR